MKRVITLLLVVLFSAASFTQEKAKDDYNTVREFRNKVFSIQNREPRTSASAVKLLGSGLKGADLSVNEELRTITVRERSTVAIDNFNFSMRVPLDVGNNSIQYQSIGFETPVAVREGEKVVIGTTTMREKALIVVVTATVKK
jgi:hypothetical protein